MQLRIILMISSFFLFSQVLYSQTAADTTIEKTLPILIEIYPDLKELNRLPNEAGTYIFSGKKSEVITIDQTPLPLAAKYGRQIFAKIPGVFIYDMDGTGNQMNISTRGLDAHRGWEFNIRKDGVITNSDMYGYPASHYNIPTEAVERIELVRGTGSLQYGAQFGGMINYVNKSPDNDHKNSTELFASAGSFGMKSIHVNTSGKIGKFKYFIWANQKESDGYRNSSKSNFNAQNLSLFYDFNSRLSVKAELTRSIYLTQLAGPLTDSLYKANPLQATRNRNYYSPEIYVPSFQLKWKLSSSFNLQFTSSAVLGTRSSVLYDKPANVQDSISSLTSNYANRQVDIDNFNSYTNELRILKTWSRQFWSTTTASGLQYMNNDLHRRQQGKGSTGSDYDINLVQSGWGRDIHFKTQNWAFYIEQSFKLKNKWIFNLAGRYENGKSVFDGTTVYYDANLFRNVINHRFPLFGGSFQHYLTRLIEVYGGFSQAYRPVILKDITPVSVFELVDKNLKDAKGYNAELGFRGALGNFSWDLTAYFLRYQNKLGNVALNDESGNLLIYRTNIGDSETKGLEMFVQYKKNLGTKIGMEIFSSTSFTNAKYQNASIRNGFDNVDVSGNNVESTPTWISRNGLNVYGKRWKLGVLYSYVDESFADALNSREPSLSGATGLVPSYGLWDLNAEWNMLKELSVSANLSNALNKSYFTKRPQFYPGPGIWPSDGRFFLVTVKFKFNEKSFTTPRASTEQAAK